MEMHRLFYRLSFLSKPPLRSNKVNETFADVHRWDLWTSGGRKDGSREGGVLMPARGYVVVEAVTAQLFVECCSERGR
jgi:hypothetical protein